MTTASRWRSDSETGPCSHQWRVTVRATTSRGNSGSTNAPPCGSNNCVTSGSWKPQPRHAAYLSWRAYTYFMRRFCLTVQRSSSMLNSMTGYVRGAPISRHRPLSVPPKRHGCLQGHCVADRARHRGTVPESNVIPLPPGGRGHGTVPDVLVQSWRRGSQAPDAQTESEPEVSHPAVAGSGQRRDSLCPAIIVCPRVACESLHDRSDGRTHSHGERVAFPCC